jgi:hypothetical protein
VGCETNMGFETTVGCENDHGLRNYRGLRNETNVDSTVGSTVGNTVGSALKLGSEMDMGSTMVSDTSEEDCAATEVAMSRAKIFMVAESGSLKTSLLS